MCVCEKVLLYTRWERSLIEVVCVATSGVGEVNERFGEEG